MYMRCRLGGRTHAHCTRLAPRSRGPRVRPREFSSTVYTESFRAYSACPRTMGGRRAERCVNFARRRQVEIALCCSAQARSSSQSRILRRSHVSRTPNPTLSTLREIQKVVRPFASSRLSYRHSTLLFFIIHYRASRN